MSFLGWERPVALLALLLPFAVLLAARLLERPLELATGTLAVWQRVGATRTSPARRARPRIPPAVWLLAAALVLGALALAGPRATNREPPRRFRVLVDRSPSMELPLGRGTRRDRATAMARAWLEQNARPGDAVEWQERWNGMRFEDDQEGTLWVTDRAPTPRPARAGFFASGGSAVPGPIAVDGSTRYDWDGEKLVEIPGGATARRVEVKGTLPATLAGMVGAWGEARGAEIGAAPDERPALVISCVDASSEPSSRREIEAGRDGWKAAGVANGTARTSDASEPLEIWLADEKGEPLVTWRPGRIDCAWESMDDPHGDPAAFAVSWAQLLDAAVLPPAGVVELGERIAAGEEAISSPQGAAFPSAAAALAPVDAWLALAALAAVVVAWRLAGWPGVRG